MVRDHSARVYRLAYRLTGNVPDAEDLTQEVFVRVFRSLPTYTPGTFEGWLHRITTNLFLDMARRRQRIRFEGLGDDAAGRLSGDEPTPAQAFDARHLDGDVQQALAALAPEYRAAVVLCDIEGLSYEEVASTLGVKLGTVRSRIHRGRAQLRVALEHRRPRQATGAVARARSGLRAERAGVSHLGQRLSALIDGELSHAQRERVLAHLAQCEPCRREAAALRVLKQRMHALGEATANTALTDRLVALGARGPVPGSIGLSRRRWPVRSIAVAFVTVAGLGVPAAAFMAGGGSQQEPGPGVTPAIDSS